MVTKSEDFGDSSWVKTSVTVTATGVADPFGGTNASTLTSSVANGFITSGVLTGSGASGFVMVFSVYMRIASGTNVIRTEIEGVGTADHSVDTSWKRFLLAGTIGAQDPLLIRIGGNSTWGSSEAVDVYGAQMTPMAGPGALILTPGGEALHAKCRFDSDRLSIRYVAKNHHAASIPIIEYF